MTNEERVVRKIDQYSALAANGGWPDPDELQRELLLSVLRFGDARAAGDARTAAMAEVEIRGWIALLRTTEKGEGFKTGERIARAAMKEITDAISKLDLPPSI